MTFLPWTPKPPPFPFPFPGWKLWPPNMRAMDLQLHLFGEEMMREMPTRESSWWMNQTQPMGKNISASRQIG